MCLWKIVDDVREPALSKMALLTSVALVLLFVSRATCQENVTDVKSDVDKSSDDVVLYRALHGYGVTVTYLVMNVVVVSLAVWMVVLNALVLHTLLVLKAASEQEPADLFIGSLALADSLNGLALLYNTAYNMANFQQVHECLFRMGLIQILNVSSVLHLLALTADRFLKIMRPYSYGNVCMPRAVAGISLGLWALSTLFGMLPLMGMNTDSQRVNASASDPNNPICSFFGLLSRDFLAGIVVIFLGTFFLMAVMYVFIFRVAFRHARAIAALEQVGSRTGASERRNLRFTKTILLILGTFVACWLPAGILIILELLGYLDHLTVVQKGNLIVYLGTAGVLNSLINPIIYAVKITAVRHRFRQVFCRKPVTAADLDASTVAPSNDLRERRRTRAWTTAKGQEG